MSVDPKKVEVLKVWYSVFCTLVDAHVEHAMVDSVFMHKMNLLRRRLAEEIPEVEEEMKRSKQ